MRFLGERRNVSVPCAERNRCAVDSGPRGTVPINSVLPQRRICGFRHRPWDARYCSRLKERGSGGESFLVAHAARGPRFMSRER